MVASNIRFMVIEVPASSDALTERSSARELMAEADPYIASLIRKLQAEVRQERAGLRRQPLTAGRIIPARAEAAPPLSESPIQFEVPERLDDDWPLLRDFEEE